ncbi:MAG: Crp/Fnr family transcriptional regulator, partial [Pseudomonadota bacterium]|nr:Crp/Fnr family transcriptional regulator [Pseudomonadota bacterium]
TDGLIKYHRGMIHIVDRKGLEHVACECYSVVRRFNGSFEPHLAPSRETRAKSRAH